MSRISGMGWMNMLNNYSGMNVGTYGNLMKAYYGSGKSTAKTLTTGINKRNTYTNPFNSLNKVSSSTTDLKTSLNKLTAVGKNSVFEKKAVKQESGQTTYEYDKDAIYNASSDFVKSYNSTIDSGLYSTSSTVKTNIASMSRLTGYMKGSLEKIGITQDKQGKLYIDEETFKAADMDTVKNLIGPRGLTSSISYNASRIQSAASNEMLFGTSRMYGSTGMYSNLLGLGNFFNSYF